MAMTCCSKVIGFGGVSCGGKTTLSTKIKSTLPSTCVTYHQDDYYWPEEHSFWKNDGTDNWDDISAFDLEKLLKDLQEEISQGTPYIILDGIMLYEDKRLDNLINDKYFFTLPFDLFEERRLRRNYQPPEPFPLYYKEVYWPVYQQQLVLVRKRADIGV
ncbi:nicotinamide riboside kinase 2-like isoform X2 [Watersipora subatra]|uniref:nicotinamide riboside kinase 2-like isoform X2 n=1 Tax=Watersipora subatra TaxID=2589382 RepID=UPI00355B1D41